MYYNKKLSYRKQIARQLRTQYLEGIYSNSVTLKPERSLKVIQTAITRKLWCVSYSSSIVTMALSCIVCERLTGQKSRNFYTPSVFSAPLGVTPAEFRKDV